MAAVRKHLRLKNSLDCCQKAYIIEAYDKQHQMIHIEVKLYPQVSEW